MEKNPPEYILIIKLSAIGDVIHTLPFLEVIRRRYPEAAIDWLIEEDASQIIEGHKELDRIIVSRRKSWQRAFLRSGKRMERDHHRISDDVRWKARPTLGDGSS